MTVALRSLPPLPRVVIAPAVTKGSWTLLKLSNAETVVSQGTSHDRPYDTDMSSCWLQQLCRFGQTYLTGQNFKRLDTHQCT